MCVSVLSKNPVHTQHLTYIYTSIDEDVLAMYARRTQYTVCASVFIINILACVADGLTYNQTCVITKVNI